MNLTNLSLRLNGYAIAAAKKKLEHLNKKVALNQEAYSHHMRTEILEFHIKNNLFYRNFVGKKPIEWESLPILTKADLQQPLSKRLSDGFSENTSHVHKTSGSSGNPFIFAKDKFCHALTWASIQHLYVREGVNLSNSYEARFYGMPENGFAHYKERLKDLLSNRHRFSIFDASEENFENFIKHFKKKKFGHLNGYTSTFVLFAQYLRSKNQILKELCPSLTHCIVTAEMLMKEDQLLLEQQFGIPVLNEYGSSETGVIAFGKAGESLKIDSALLYVEILNEENKPVKPGESGKIIITSLFNKVHPFIRYQIGDLGILEYDENKAPFLTNLEGRVGDYALLPDGKKVPALAFYYVTKTIINDSSSVKEFTITQSKPNTFDVIYVANTGFTELETKKIRAALIRYLGQNLQINLIKKEVLDRSKRGKIKQFKRTF